MTVEDQIADRLERVWEPEFSGSIWQWAEGLQMPGSAERGGVFKPDESPWLLPIFEALTDHRVREVVVMAPAGSAKTMLMEIYIAWIVKNDPARTYFVSQTDDDVKDTMEDRVLKTLGANAARGVVMPTDRNKKRAMKIIFPNMELYAMGANPNNAQAKRVKYLLMDETHAYDPGMIEAFRGRQNTVSGPKCLIISTGCITDDQTDAAYRAGHMAEYHVCCPECGRAQAMTNQRLIYEKSERTVDGQGNYKMDALLDTIRYKCQFEQECGALWEDTEMTRRELLRGAHYVAQNPNAASKVRSFHFPYMIVPWLSWRDGITKWLAGNRAASLGILDDRREYIQKWLAESWDESPREEDKAHLGKLVGFYIKRSAWADEIARFCTADQQEKEFYCVCKAWAANGESRTIDAEVLQTFEDYELWRIANQAEAGRTGLDIAFNTSISQQRLAQYGWTGLWGDDRRNWPHDQRSPFHPVSVAKAARQRGADRLDVKPVLLPFSPPQRAQAGLGLSGKIQIVRYYYWSNPWVKDIWHHLHNGLGASFTHANDIDPLYVAQTQNEVKTLTFDKGTGRKSKWVWVVPSKKSTDKTKQDHYLDADQMNLAMALMDDRISLSKAILGGEEILPPEPVLEIIE